MSINLAFHIAGLDLLLLETATKKDSSRKFHTFRLPTQEHGSFFGQQIPALGTSLPTEVVIDGVKVSLTHGLTSATKSVQAGVDPVTNKMTYKDEPIPESERRPSATFNGHQTIPSLKGFDGPEDEGIRNVKVTISETKTPGVWNVKVTVNRVATVSPEQQRQTATDKAAAALASLVALANLQGTPVSTAVSA